MERNDVYLIDMWRLLLREWRWFVAVLAVVLLGTFAFTRVVSPQWQATAWVQIGQVDTAPPGQDPKVEPLPRVIERLQLPLFQNETLQSIGIGPDTREAGLYRGTLKLEPMYFAGPLLKLSVRAHSPQQARAFAEATVEHLRTVHQGLEAVPLNLARARLAEVETALQQATAERDRLQQSAVQNKDSVAGVLLAGKNGEITTLQQTRSDLQVRLSTAYTYETSLMWPVFVPRGPVFPNPALSWGVGMLFGLFLGMCAAVIRNAVRRRLAAPAVMPYVAQGFSQ
jgi:uncharacterized protein involved in exopolysaccharide biosynthesis